MLSTHSNFIQRFISAIFLTPLILFALVWSPWSYFFLFFYVVLLTMLEFYKLIKQAYVTPMRLYGILFGLLCYTATFAYYVQDHLSPLLGYAALLLLVCLPIIALYRRRFSNPFLDMAVTLLAVLYIAFPCSMLHQLAFFKGTYSYELIVGLLLIVWSQDIGAYFVGSTIGKRKLFERISPNKTWEGSIGGGICALIAGYSIPYVLHLSIIAPWQWMAIAVLTIFTGTYGDLVASLLKRSVAVKHSGSTIPGHGGFLDRIDSLLLTVPTVVAFLHISALWA
ncbi:phosphatidate cytidylyltransferase [Candidatus Cardinium hertigii]|nr:phosphatidate cytidylyltransferase [Candidatus Cardinium hertigii]